MNRLEWKEIVNKTKYASRKKRLSKAERCDLAQNVLTLQNFMARNTSENRDANRKEVFYKRG